MDYPEEHTSKVFEILDCLRSTKRFSLSLQFLSSDENKQCQTLFKQVEDTNNNLDLEQLSKWTDVKTAFGIKWEDGSVIDIFHLCYVIDNVE